MYQTINQIGEDFKSLMLSNVGKDNVLNVSKEEYQKFCDDSYLKFLKAYAEYCDEAIYNDKKGRKKEGLVVERKKDIREIFTMWGQLRYERNYYFNKMSGGYLYPADAILGVAKGERISLRIATDLVKAAVNNTYVAASEIVTGGIVSKQTVMNKVRMAKVAEEVFDEKKERPAIKVLHIDADEDHISSQNGRDVIAPLVSVYEGIETKGKRRSCKNVFHLPFFGTSTEDIWDRVLTEIECRYDISGSDVTIYLHGDGASWIKKGAEFLPNVRFVLDKYHMNKYVKQAVAGISDKKIREDLIGWLKASLYAGDTSDVEAIGKYVLDNSVALNKDKIGKAFNYLLRNIAAISILCSDPEANNGGATEPHVSHVLSARFSSRPKGWSAETLRCLVPLRSGRGFSLCKREVVESKVVDKCLKKEGQIIKKAVKKSRLGLVDPDMARQLQNGHLTPIARVLRAFSN